RTGQQADAGGARGKGFPTAMRASARRSVNPSRESTGRWCWWSCGLRDGQPTRTNRGTAQAPIDRYGVCFPPDVWEGSEYPLDLREFHEHAVRLGHGLRPNHQVSTTLDESPRTAPHLVARKSPRWHTAPCRRDHSNSQTRFVTRVWPPSIQSAARTRFAARARSSLGVQIARISSIVPVSSFRVARRNRATPTSLAIAIVACAPPIGTPVRSGGPSGAES